MASKDYWINVMRLSGGVMLGQVIGILGFLFLTWIYRPAEFGVYASWMAVVAIGSVVCTGALETSLVRDADGAQRRDATVSVMWTALLGAVLFAAACGLGLSNFPGFIPGNRLVLSMSIGVAVFALAGTIVLQSWAAAEGRFRALTFQRIIQSSFVMLAPLFMSLFGTTSSQLIWGHALGLCAALLAWLAVFPREALRTRPLSELLAFWKGRSRCFVYVLPALIVGTVAGNMPQLLVNWRFGAEVAGYLALAQRVLGVPLSLVGAAVRDVFKRYASVAYRERGECVREFWSTFAALAVVAAAFAAVIWPFGEVLFVFVFGEAWRLSGQMARWLLVLFVFAIVASPLTYLVYIVEREDFDLWWQSALLVVVVAALSAFAELKTTFNVFAFAYAAMYVVYILACARFARGR